MFQNPQQSSESPGLAGFLYLSHDYVQALTTKRLTGSEIQLLWVVIALTIGYHRTESAISLAEFSQSTGLKKQRVFDLLKNLQERQILFIRPNQKENGKKDCHSYQINPDWQNWISVKNKGELKQTNKAMGVYRPNKHAGPISTQPHHAPAPVIPQVPKNEYNPYPFIENPVPEIGYEPYQLFDTPVPEIGYEPYQFSGTIYKDTSKEILDKNTSHIKALEDFQKKPCRVSGDALSALKGYIPVQKRQQGKALLHLILFAEKECDLTIVGENVEQLEKLLDIKSIDTIKEALIRFKTYQNLSKKKREFTLSEDFANFFQKIDCFLAEKALADLLENEERQIKEAYEGDLRETGRQEPGSYNARETAPEPTGDIQYHCKTKSIYPAPFQRYKYSVEKYAPKHGLISNPENSPMPWFKVFFRGLPGLAVPP